MKKLLLLIALIVGFSFTGCKKSSDNNTNEDVKYSTLQSTTNDNNSVDKIIDESLMDAENLIGTTKSTFNVPCNVTMDSTRVVGDTITKYFTYNGNNCNNTFKREGKMEIKHHVNTHWFNIGATIFIKHINFKVTKLSNGEWKIFNSDKKHINVLGGLIVQLGNGVTIIKHRTTGNVDVTFQNNQTKSWQISRQKIFILDNTNLRMRVEGFGEADGYNHLVTWGVNRDGENFYSKIDSVVVFKQECDWDPCSGVRFITIPSDNKNATITYGYKNNLPVPLGECPTQYKLYWVKGSNNGTVYINL